MNQDFLVELGTEELPPKALLSLAEAFAAAIVAGLKAQQLAFADAVAYATPRRLAVVVNDLEASTPVREVAVWGPPVKIAFDKAGKPTQAAAAFARKNGVDISQLRSENDGKIDKLVLRTQVGGVATTTLLADIVTAALAKLPIPKRMRWGAYRTEFVRPVHWLVMLYGSDIVDATVLGLRAHRQTRGHRCHYDQVLDIACASEYARKLTDVAYVIPNFNHRKAIIEQQVNAQAASVGGTAVIDAALLEEVTALVEWPVALIGRFEQRFLAVPAAALISSMKSHQKYFHLVDSAGKLMPYFIAVANLDSKDPAQVIDGNERVIRPRLADAAFFFATDKKTSLASKRERLHKVVFQEKLGSLFAKTERLAKLSQTIATALGLNSKQVVRAAELCKCDLVTEMVYEFADMQGIAGYHYAIFDGEPDNVATAINEHYMPRFAGDDLPSTDIGAVLALADRLDTLVGIFAIGQQPSGSKDPFALRRASVGVLRLLVEQQRQLDLRELLTWALHQYSCLPETAAVIEQVLQYMLERLRAWYDEQGIPVAVWQAVSAKQLSQPLDIDQRVQAVNHFRQLPEAEALAAANKRVANILAKADNIASVVDTSILQEPAETALYTAVNQQQQLLMPLLADRHYTQTLTTLASLRAVVDQFFADVMVMTDDKTLKNNRLALLQQLRGLFLQVADISYLAATKQ